MAIAEPREEDLHSRLAETVGPLLSAAEPLIPADGSVPQIVLAHRQRRARERLLDALVSRGSASVPAPLLRELRTLVQSWAGAAFSDGFEAVEAFEIRCAAEHDRVAAEESGDSERLLDVLENEHRRRIVEQLGRIELKGIQTSHRVLQDLDVVYVPLHLEAPPEETEGKAERVITDLIRPRVEASKVLCENRHVLVVGAPGSGKSTLISYLATRAAAGRLSRELGWADDPLPLVLAVRSLKSANLTARGIASHTGCEPEVVRRALKRGRAFLFIDGLDEAPEALRLSLIESLHGFIRRNPETHLLVTSRAAGAPGEVEKSLHGLRPYRLVDLAREEVDEFIDKWCLAAEISLRKGRSEAERVAGKSAGDLKSRLTASYSVQRIAVNPLLVTILCVVHRFLGRTIPEHRVTLYEKCTDALLYEWDRAKFEEGAAIGLLDAQSKRRLLMGVASRVHEEHAAEISEEEVVQHFATILPDLGRPKADAKKIVAEIRDRSGLLVERRPGFFAFSHLTFQEYLCALDYATHKRFDELVRHHHNPWWHEVIILAAGTQTGSGGAISRRLLRKKDDTALALAAQCLETEADMPISARKEIERWLEKFIPPRRYEDVERIAKLGVVAAPLLTKLLHSDLAAKELSWVLESLDRINYEPAIPQLARLTSDSRVSLIHLDMGQDESYRLTIGGLSTFILEARAYSSSIARRVLPNAIWHTPLEDLEAISAWRGDLQSDVALLVQEVLNARRREGAPRKSDKGTA